MSSNAELLAHFRKCTVRTVKISGKEITVRGLNGVERAAFTAALSDPNPAGRLPDYQIAFWGWCDSEGVRKFGKPEELSELDGEVLHAIAREILKASGIYTVNDGEKSSVEVAQGN